MIVTEDLVRSIDVCEEAIIEFRQRGWYGLSRHDFLQQVKAAGNSMPNYYYPWMVDRLFKYKTITHKSNKQIKTGRYRTIFADGTIQEFITKQEARAAGRAARKAYNDTNTTLHHIITRTKVEGGTKVESIDLNTKTIPVADSYEAANIKTGQYEPFATFTEAKARALELRAKREAETDPTFVIEEEVQEVDPDPDMGIITDWAPLGPA